MKQPRLIKTLWGKGQFQTKSEVERNKNRQRHGASRVLEVLGMLTDLEGKELPVEFFFLRKQSTKSHGPC